MIAALTGAGLASAAGLNAFIPYLVVALMARFTSLIDLPQQYEWIQSWPSIAVATVLLISEAFFDKIAVVDHVNDAVATVIRPTVGALIFLATSAAESVDESTFMQENPWVPLLLGAVFSGVVHGAKVTARPVVNTASLGLGTPVVSAAEDGVSLGTSLVAIIAPFVVAVVIIPAMVGAVWFVIRVRRRPQVTSGHQGPM